MSTKVFLSLANIDENFVNAIRKRLPSGVAYFYRESFENGELLIEAMERAVDDSAVFVLFASASALKSPWVGFEISRARLQQIQKASHRILVFPTDDTVRVNDLPEWLRGYWIERAGWGSADIARYITGVLLEPNVGISQGAVKIIGRGKTQDKLEQIAADHLGRTGASPAVYFLTGFRGVGRRTFASYYMRTALTPDANLTYGPTVALSALADLVDFHQALRMEISPTMPVQDALRERDAFLALSLDDQIAAVIRLINHFSNLGQAVTLVSAGGFFEDRGDPKSWVLPLLETIPKTAILFVVSNRQISPEKIQNSSNIVQMRVAELDDKDIRALMIRTAERLKVDKFTISDQLIRAIGGHADVANAAVRLVAIKGTHILERDPRQLFNIQNTILGENVESDALSEQQKKILGLLSWVPSLNGDLLEKVLIDSGLSAQEVLEALENLILGCLVIANGPSFAISPAIRFLFRRFNPTSADLLKTFSSVLSAEWKAEEQKGNFRTDLFEAFIFMHSLEGSALPAELRPLVTPGMLVDVMRETYSRGKDEPESLAQVISWGELASDMKMSEATREEVLSTIARAKIRLGNYGDAEKVIQDMANRGYRSVAFLRGHSYRRQRNYGKAIEFLVEAARSKKFNRSAVHELALAYKKSGRVNDLRKLLVSHEELIRDSAMFADFQIGIDLARGDIRAAEIGIENLRRMPDDHGQSDVRVAQLLMRRLQFRDAKSALTKLLRGSDGDNFRIRSLRAICAARDGDFDVATKDIDFIKKFPTWSPAAFHLEALVLLEKRRPLEAREMLERHPNKGPEDLLLYARILEAVSELPTTSVNDRQDLKKEASQIRASNNFALEYDLVEGDNVNPI